MSENTNDIATLDAVLQLRKERIELSSEMPDSYPEQIRGHKKVVYEGFVASLKKDTLQPKATAYYTH